MASTAVDLRLEQAVRFYRATIGKKVVMAVTGCMLFGYVVAHLIGNLQIYAGRDRINHYAELLHSAPVLLWAARSVLLAAVILHFTAAFQLWLLNRAARPLGYAVKDDVPSAYAARTMIWSGPLIAAFVVFHILHLTTGSLNLPFKELDVYDNVVNGFRIIPVSIAYIAAMVMLGMHLYHGIWSMFQSVGFSHPRYTPWLKGFSAGFGVLIAAGNISIPVAVMTGLIGS